MFGGNLICGFSYIMGRPVGILANSGPITGRSAILLILNLFKNREGDLYDRQGIFRETFISLQLFLILGADAQKGGHFVQLCDNRDIPILFLQESISF